MNNKLDELFVLVNDTELNEEFTHYCNEYYKLYCNKNKTEDEVTKAILHLKELSSLLD